MSTEPGPEPSQAATIDQAITIWSKAVETQMHFNEMSVKSRQLGLTFVTAALALAAVLLSKGDEFSFYVSLYTHKLIIHASVLIIFAAILGLTAVRILDLNVYHKMLRGAVSFGEDFEKKFLLPHFPLSKGMTGAISHFSRFADAAVDENDGGYQYKGSDKKSAEVKIREFYKYTIVFLVVSALVLFVLSNLSALQGGK